MLRFAQQLVQEAVKSGQFAFPPVTDVRIDQAKSEIVIDRDKVASMGLSLQQVGADLASMLGGNFVNRFNIDGPQLQGHSADRARRAAHSRPAERHLHHGSERTAHAAQRRGDDSTEVVEPRTLNRFQQLNAVKISGRRARAARSGLRVLEDSRGQDSAAGLPRRLHRRIAPAAAGGGQVSSRPWASRSCSSSWCSRRSSTRSAIRSSSSPARCRSRMFGALIFTFLKFAGPPGMHFKLTEGWTTTLNIYSQVGLVTLVGLVSKNGILIVEFANELQQRGHEQDRGGARPRRHASAARFS